MSPLIGARRALLSPDIYGPGFTSVAALAGLKLWYDASDASTLFQDSALTTPATLDTDPVGGWTNKAGLSAGNLLQATAAARPTLATAAHNGLNAVRFAGTDDSMGSSSAVYAQPNSLIIVCSMTDNTAQGQVCDGSNPTRHGMRHTAGSSVIRWFADFSSERATTASFTAGLAIISFQANGGSSKLYLNGSLIDAGNIGTASLGGFMIGKNETGGGLWVGDFVEIIFTDTLMLINARKGVERYLADKWGVTLTG